MNLGPPSDSGAAILAEPEACTECHSVSRLTNGLCLNCLLRGALGNEEEVPGKEAFKEALAAVKSRYGDWHVADHEILNEIARGGMGVVYQAREPHSERIVALKCVLAYQGDSDQALARFRREAETAARLDHPNIVPIYQVGETADGFPYYTMKYAAEGSLLRAREPLLQHPGASVELMLKVTRAVQYAHEQGVLHRDLKPGNILLDSRREPLVSDFGLARCEANSSYLTRSLASFGTPGYIAPEQADGPAANLTAAADLYSLGALLFELLTGRPPFVGDNAFAVMKQSAEKPAPKLRTLAQYLDRDLETICARCLEREPEDRYQSAVDLADDLQRWLEDRPIAVRRRQLWLHTRRWVRHNRRLAALLAVFCLVGIGSIAWQIRAQRIQSAMKESVLAQRSVVVLPFLDLDNVTPDPILAQSLATTLQGQLDAFGPARITVGSAPGWGQAADIRRAGLEARARTVLTGTVRHIQGRTRISLQMLDSATSDPLFAKQWEESAGKAQLSSETKDLSKRVYEILSANDWSGLRRTEIDPVWRNEVGSEAIRAGRDLVFHYTVADLDLAIELFKKAIAAEPNSSVAHSYLAIAAISRTHFVADLTFLELGKVEAQIALQLSPNSVEAHRALAGVLFQEEKFQEALEEQIGTIEMGGVEDKVAAFVGMTLDMLGRPDQALKWYRLSSGLQDTPGDVDALIGDSWSKLSDDEQAIRAYDRAIELRPGSSQGVIGKCHICLLQGNFEAAREICRSHLGNGNELGEMAQIAAQIEFFARNFAAAEELYRKLGSSDADGGGSFYGTITYQSALGRIRQTLGDNEAATKLLQDSLAKETAALNRRPRNPEAPYRLAAVEASLGLHEASLQHLRQAAALGWMDYRSLSLDPRFDSLRTNPALQIFVSEISARVAEMRSTAKK
ncbi:MAG: hypothetical protein DLM73_04575 [Chthoniobacterales bacterium]|nr:MAG: hypothetical protein DLM73_04575 [Chthoniobacterales bacterium]